MCANVEAATTLAAAGIAYVVVPCIPDLSKVGLVAVPLGGVDPPLCLGCGCGADA